MLLSPMSLVAWREIVKLPLISLTDTEILKDMEHSDTAAQTLLFSVVV